MNKVKVRIIVILILIFFPATSIAGEWYTWTESEKNHYTVSAILMLIDMQYSLDIKNHPELHEQNSLFSSEYPTDKEYYQKTVLALAGLAMTNWILPEEYSTTIDDVISGIEIFIIDGHITLGLNFKF